MVQKKSIVIIALIFISIPILAENYSAKHLHGGEELFAQPLANVDHNDEYTTISIPLDNGSIKLHVYQNQKGSTYLTTEKVKIKINNSIKQGKPDSELNIASTEQGIGISSTNVIASWIEAPAYWDRGTTITIKVGFKIYLRYTYTATITVKSEIYDKYLKQLYFYEKKEASSQKTTTISLRPRVTKYVYVPVSIGYTTVGLKKIIVKVTRDLQYNFNEGYNYVQRFNRNEFNPSQLPSYAYELSDIYHFNKWSIIRKAGEAVDYWDETMTSAYRTAKKLNSWIHDSFQYTDTDEFRDLTWGDERIMETYDGKYHGVCDEYAVLFISFARAVNIPARQIYIEGFYEGKWQGHAFAEIWEGSKWVHADSTWNIYDFPQIYKLSGYSIKCVEIWFGADDSRCTEDDPPEYAANPDEIPSDGIVSFEDFSKLSYPYNPYQ